MIYWQTFIRAILKFGGGFLVAKGIFHDDSLEVVISLVAAVVGTVWGWWEKRQTERQIQALLVLLSQCKSDH